MAKIINALEELKGIISGECGEGKRFKNIKKSNVAIGTINDVFKGGLNRENFIVIEQDPNSYVGSPSTAFRVSDTFTIKIFYILFNFNIHQNNTGTPVLSQIGSADFVDEISDLLQQHVSGVNWTRITDMRTLPVVANTGESVLNGSVFACNMQRVYWRKTKL